MNCSVVLIESIFYWLVLKYVLSKKSVQSTIVAIAVNIINKPCIKDESYGPVNSHLLYFMPIFQLAILNFYQYQLASIEQWLRLIKYLSYV